MNLREELHSAYILHARAYRETSLLLEVLSAQHGRVTVVARGAKRGKLKLSSLLQPFLPLQISWYGNGDLVTLVDVETKHPGPTLYGRSAICGLYINELLIKLLPKWDHCAHLFSMYETTILQLAGSTLDQIILRKFELQLLKSLGYGLQLNKEVTTGATIDAQSYYMFDPELGPKLTPGFVTHAFKGSSLLSLANETWESHALLDMKRLMRIVLRHHLGNKQLKSRELL